MNRYSIQAQVEFHDQFGVSWSRQIPTFFVDAMDVFHAIEIARGIFTDVWVTNPDISERILHVTAMDEKNPGILESLSLPLHV